MKIGNKIKKIRDLKGIPVKEMAGKLNLSINGYSKIEREEVELSLVKLENIAKIFNVDIQFILEFDVDSFLNSYKESKKNNTLIEQLKMENDKLWSLLQR